MFLKVVFAVACLQASLAFIVEAAPVPNELEAVPYEVLNKTKDFEIRRYPTFRYAMAREVGVGLMTAGSRNFMKLFGYISGHNKDQQKIPMTIPVVQPLRKDENGGYQQDFTTLFWIPSKFQDSPPEPIKAEKSANQVRIIEWGDEIVYVRTFGWWPIETLIRYNEHKLQQSLEEHGLKAGIDFDPSMVYSACYNSPMQIFGRRNEVMFQKIQH